MSAQTHIIVFQEVCLLPDQFHKFQTQARAAGYNCYAALGTDRVSVRGVQGSSGGVTVLIRDSIKATPCQAWQGSAGQCLALDFGSFLLLAVYRRPADTEVPEMTEHVCQTVWANRPRQPWVIVGDFNWSPSLNPWVPLLANSNACPVAAKCADGHYLPTRWEGRECLDYVLTNVAQQCDAELEHTKWGDHIPISIRMALQPAATQAVELKPTARYQCPTDMSEASWCHKLESAWMQTWSSHSSAVALRESLQGPPNPDEELRLFNELVAHASSTALRDYQRRSTSGSYRPKGSQPSFLIAPDRKAHSHDFQSYEQRTLRKRLGRLLEAQRCISRGDYDAALQLRRRASTSSPANAPLLPIHTAVQIAQDELDRLVRAQHLQRLNAWKARMRASGLAIKRWIHSSASQAPSCLILDDERGTDAQHSIRLLKTYWQRVWNRQCDPKVHVA